MTIDEAAVYAALTKGFRDVEKLDTGVSLYNGGMLRLIESYSLIGLKSMGRGLRPWRVRLFRLVKLM